MLEERAMMKKRTITSREELVLLLELGVPVKDGWMGNCAISISDRDFFLQRGESSVVARWLARGDYYVEEE